METPRESKDDTPHVAVQVGSPAASSPLPLDSAPAEQTAAPPSWREEVSGWKLLDTFANNAAHNKNANKDLKRFYKRQHEAIAKYLELDELQREAYRANRGEGGADMPVARRAEDDRGSPVAFWGTVLSLALNVCLLGIKTYALVTSKSLTVAASLMDSALDLFSGGVLVLVTYLRHKLAPAHYPTGKHRFEPIGTLIFSCAMCVAAAKLLEECITDLVDPSRVDTNINTATMISIAVVIGSKLIAWRLCARVRDEAPSLDALAKDHRNDVVSNSVGLAGITIARYWWIYIDPLVAMVTAFAIMIVWSRNAYEQVQALSARLAPPEVLNALTLLARNHDPRVLAVDTVRAVTGGEGFIVEIDLLLPADMPLKEAHDIGESFQVFLEGLKPLDIARAYVHLDYETEHDPREHR